MIEMQNSSRAPLGRGAPSGGTPLAWLAPPSAAFRTGALAITLVFTVLVLAQIGWRDLWMDEAWSLYLTDPTVPLAQLVRERLSLDMHPPLFNVFLHAMREWLPAGLPALRAVNALVLLPVTLYLALVWRRAPQWRTEMAIFVLLLCTGMFFVHFAAEGRVYWTLLLASVCYAVAGHRTVTSVLADQRPAPADVAVWFVGSALLLHLHAYSAIFVTLHGGLDLLLLAWHRRWRFALAYFAWMLVFGLLLVSWYWFGTEFLRGMGLGGGWISQLDLLRALRRVAGFLLHTVPNPALLLLAALALPTLLRNVSTGATPAGTGGTAPPVATGETQDAHEPLTQPQRLALRVDIAAILLFSAGIAIGNLFTPLIVDRYFATLSGPLSLFVAVLACAGLASRPQATRGALGAAILACALGAGAFELHRERSYWNEGLYWGPSARYAVELHGRCPQPLMHATSNEFKYAANEEIALSWGAQEYARTMGFRTQRAEPGSTLRVGPECPMVLWVLLIQGGAERSSVDKLLDEFQVKLEGARREDLELVSFGTEGVIRLRR